MTITTLGDFLHWAEQSFLEADLYFGHGTDNAWDEALALASHVLALPRIVPAEMANQILNSKQISQLQILMEKRIQTRIPLPYLSHEAWFAGLQFYVDERVI